MMSALSDLSLTDRIALPTRAVRQWSVNHFKTWRRCRRKFELDVVQALRWPSDQRNFALGQDVHKLMDYQARGFDCEALVAAASPGVQRAWRLLMAHPASQWPAIASEWGFLTPLATTPRSWLTGRIDRISKDPQTGRIWVIDWKTGTAAPREPHADWQTIAYRYAVCEAKRELGLDASFRPEEIGFLYVEVKDRIRVMEIPYDQDAHEAARCLLRDTAQAMTDARAFPLPPSCPDRHCPYSPVCGIRATSGP
ncbi:MAG: PD-(D/E)XK nuclease family protein [Vampirovibrionales bacterium]|nr:PD-(D/E)XK nuclease family protein [Vampirovibrionales bacterium]